MSNIDELKREIIALIDDNYSNWRKAAFYSDPVVVNLMDKLQVKWESNERRGYPIDYATPEELELLHRIAKRYAYMSEDEARSLVFSRQSGETSSPESRDEGSSLSRLLKRLIGK
ncbi:MAG: hypothetical protein GSR85_09445 [Desulfurococcales archaeon]|nr:hypothetical protein [Desulfurococcales archaeon]